MRELTVSDVEISVTTEEEWDRPDQHFDDPELVAKVRELYEEGNDWAWCTVKVQLEWMGLTTEAYLGACSYENEEEFKKDEYYHQMVREALDDLNKQVQRIVNAVNN